jgi:hypothetical protein
LRLLLLLRPPGRLAFADGAAQSLSCVNDDDREKDEVRARMVAPESLSTRAQERRLGSATGSVE